MILNSITPIKNKNLSEKAYQKFQMLDCRIKIDEYGRIYLFEPYKEAFASWVDFNEYLETIDK